MQEKQNISKASRRQHNEKQIKNKIIRECNIDCKVNFFIFLMAKLF